LGAFSVDILSYMRIILGEYNISVNGHILEVLLLLPALYFCTYSFWEFSLIFFFFIGLIEYKYAIIFKGKEEGGEERGYF
jgi:hypothetical protein